MNIKLSDFLKTLGRDTRVYSEIRWDFSHTDFVVLESPTEGCVGVLKPSSAWHQSDVFSTYWMNGKEYLGRTPDLYQPLTTGTVRDAVPLTTEVYVESGRDFTVVRDDLLPGGTKQRALMCYVCRVLKKNPNVTELVYAGPSHGAAQVAMGVVAQKLGLQATMFTDTTLTSISERAATYGVEFHRFPDTLRVVQEKAKKYCEVKGRYLLPFGLGDDMFRECLIQDLMSVRGILPARMWLVAGSATLLNCLYSVYPNTFFCVVQVGKTIWWDQIDPSRTRLFVSPHRFNKPAPLQPPWPTVKNYDAKLWEFVVKYGKSGDWIWNVASE